MKTTAQLTADLADFAKASGSQLRSADEMLAETDAPEERRWLAAFIVEWDAAQDFETWNATCRTIAAAERAARKRSERIGAPVLVYEVTEHGERYLGTA